MKVRLLLSSTEATALLICASRGLADLKARTKDGDQPILDAATQGLEALWRALVHADVRER